MSKLLVNCKIGYINVIDMKWYVHLLNTYMKLKIPGKIEYKNGNVYF